MSSNERVFYNPDAVMHIASFIESGGKPIKHYTTSTRWVYLVLNEEQVNQHFEENSSIDTQTQLDTIKQIYMPYLIQAIQEEEKQKYSLQTLKSDDYIIADKLVFCSHAPVYYTNYGYYSLLRMDDFYEEANKLGQPNQKEEDSLSKLLFDDAKAQSVLKNEYNKLSIQTNRKEYMQPSMIVAMPYVTNPSNHKDFFTSILTPTYQEKLTTVSYLSKYAIKGYWCDENKNRISQYDISNKDKELYFHIQTKNIPDGTQAKLTVYDKDILLHDEITTLDFTINDNEAFIKIELEKIKFNIIDLITQERDKQIELFTQIYIRRLKVKKDLAKDEEENLLVTCGYFKIGTRSLKNWPYPDKLGMFKAVHPFGAWERVLDATNKEWVHEHIAFRDDQNVGFSTAYDQNNLDNSGKEYGMLKTDPEMSGIPNTQLALNQYKWMKLYADEDTVKEAIYQVINENHYAVSDTIAQMNESDLRRASERARGAKFFQFTPIIRYTPENARRYDLFTDNCQYFVQRVRDKYEMLKSEAQSKESLS